MSEFPKTRIRFRRGTAAEFTSANPVLASGEPGFAVDTNTLKIGDGQTAWSSLSGITGGGGGSYDDTYVSGVATYASGQAIENELEVVAVSGWAESYVDSQDHSAIAVSGWAGTNFLSAVSGDASPYLGGELNLDNNDIVIDCRNETGSEITAGTPVYVSGYYANGKALIAPADASDSTKMPAFGMVNNTLADDTEGTLGVMGVVTGINTNSFTVGDVVYVASGTGFTNSKPTESNVLIQNLGRVLRKDASNGRILLLGAGRTNDVPNSGNFNELTVNSAPAVVSDTDGITGASGVSNIVYISSGDYAALGSYDASTIYFIR